MSKQQKVFDGEISLCKEVVFKQLFHKYFPRICVYAASIIKDDAVATDIAQDVFIRLWEKKLSFKSIQSFKAYLYNSIKNTCLNYLRDKKENSSIELLTDITSKEEDIESLIIEAELSAKLFEAIMELPQARREVILLRINGMTIEDIAKELNVSLNTVKSHKKLAHKQLRDNLRAAMYSFL